MLMRRKQSNLDTIMYAQCLNHQEYISVVETQLTV